jgi:hypothetical protein
VIEGGVAGGSSLQQAAQRRATAERLLAEARWLESVADDERAMADHLAALSPAYAILHDLRLPGSKGNVDHLIVGPGGAFVIVGRRCREAITYRDARLFCGEQPLHDVLQAAGVESQLLTQAVGTAVVPVVAFAGSRLPAAVPHAVEGVLVCPADLVVRMVTRAAHTSLTPQRVAEVAGRALSLVRHPGSVVRTESSLGVLPDSRADPSVTPVLPQHPPSPREAARRGRTAKETATDAGRAAEGPVTSRSGRSRSLRFVATVIAVLCVLAVGLGSLGRALWDDDDPTSGTSPPAPAVRFDAVCPTPGAGWQLTPVWTGDPTGVLHYDVDVQNLDGSWAALQPIEAASQSWASLLAQPPNTAYTVRVVAVMSSGGRSAATSMTVTTPPTAC